MKKFENHLWEIGENRFGTKMIIVNYNKKSNIMVKFQDDNEYERKTSYQHFLEGIVKNPYDLSMYSKGYIGVGKFFTTIKGKNTPEYECWCRIMKRCYDESFREKHPSYIGCTVCEDWHNFQNFAKWYVKNFYKIDFESMEIDKDILVKGNKIYGPNTSVFVPKHINLLFTKREIMRGSCCIGVDIYGRKFRSQCRDCNGTKVSLGYFTTQEEAFSKYKNFKEKTIAQIANKYRCKIPEKLYEALINYKVEVGD